MKTQLIDYCYHTHTSRCGHAVGEDEDYAREAYEAGFKELGFTDHIIFLDLKQSGLRGNPEEFRGYIDSIRKIEKEYEGKMNVYLGFECEWLGDRYRKYYEDLLKNEVDYLIIGQHSYLVGDEFVFYGKNFDDGEALERYTNDLIEGMESGLFSFVAHPDHFMSWYPLWDDKCEECARRILDKACELGIPIEINMGFSYRKKYQGRRDYLYPHPRFWEVAEEYPVKVLIGMDIHNPKYFKSNELPWFINFAKRHEVDLIDRISIKKSKPR